jgi:hypothetical protein
MNNKLMGLLAAGAALGAVSFAALRSDAGVCFANGQPWKRLYTCSANGTIDTRDSCSPFFPGGAPICVPRLSVQKNSGLITSAQGLDSGSNPIGGCAGQDTVADGRAIIRGSECSRAVFVNYRVTF